MTSAAPSVLVVDDEAPVRTALRVNLGKRGWDVTLVEDPVQAIDALKRAPFDVVITDVRMPRGSGLDLLGEVRARWPDTPVVVMTGFGSVEDAVAAMKAGAAEYLVKPVSKDALFVVLDRALAQRTLRAELVQLRRDVQERFGFDNLVGATPQMVSLYETIGSVADTDTTVLLQGPTGTGKELLAHALHYRSSRARGPLIRVNCTAMPATLMESELFGHEEGAFTGAVRRHIGRFEQASGGTIFLDEIGDMDLSMQSRLLRVLESGDFQRVGGRETLTADARVIAATHRDLKAEVREGRFREDLFYRLNVVTLRIPALRDRRDDIPLLVDHFLQREAAKRDRPLPRIPPEAMADLVAFDWPGNVRQLEHTIERAMILHDGGADLAIPTPDEEEAASRPPEGPSLPPRSDAPVEDLPAALEAFERSQILAALAAADGVQAEAARQLGISRSNLHYRLKKLGIERQIKHG